MLRVKDIMTPHPKTVEPTNSVGTAFRLMQEGGFHHLPVVENGRLVGLVHAHDLRRHLGMVSLPERTDVTPEVWEAVPLAHLMHPVRFTVTPETTVEEAVRRMEQEGITGVPVVKDEALVGIVTIRDVLRMTEDLLSLLAEREIPPAVCFVGRSGSGKTTLIERLIQVLRERGYRVGAVKHHFHPTLVDQEGKDTWRYEVAGASPVSIISAVQTAVFLQTERELPLDQVIAQYYQSVDIVLVEGYRWADKPRIEVHRSARSEELLCATEEIIALVSDREWDVPVPQFHLDDIAGLADFLERRFIQRESTGSGGGET